MIKRLLERFRRDRGIHKATVRIDFFPQDQVSPNILWHRSLDADLDTITLLTLIYARILYELAEMNEVRVARELMDFVEQVCQKISAATGPPKRPRLPLGQLSVAQEAAVPAVRTYQAEFYQLHDGIFRLEFRGSLGKESFYLPAAFLMLLQSCLDSLGEEALLRLARVLGRLHTYYRYRRDFWEGGALSAGPIFALGNEELRQEEASPEA